MASKKRRGLLLVCALMLCLLMHPAALLETALPLNETDLAFFFEGESWALNTPAAGLLTALEQAGNKLDVTQADSCLFEGKDKEYTSEEVLIGTLPKGSKGEDIIETIMVLSGDHLTSRGIGLGSKKEEILLAYGEPTLMDYDLLIYSLDNRQDSAQLVFVLDIDTETVLSYYYFQNTQV